MTSKYLIADFVRRRPVWEVIEKSLLSLVLIDLALGGNGYLVKVGSFRLREILFAFCIPWSALRLAKVNPIRLDPILVGTMILFVVVTAFDAIFGYLNGSRPGAIIAELKPLSYFAMLPFFLVAIRTRADLTLTACILVVSGTLLAIAYSLLLLTGKTGLISSDAIFDTLVASDEFIFRTGNQFIGFLYKGMFYVCIATFFLILDPFRFTKILAALAAVSIAMTLTRGLGFALILSLLIGVLLNRCWRLAFTVAGLCALTAVVMFVAQRAEQRILVGLGALPSVTQPATSHGREAPSNIDTASALAKSMQRPTDMQRTSDINYVFEHLNLSTLVGGHGLGSPVDGRERIEMTYAEILHKQGILGLSVWIILLAYLLRLYLAVPAETKHFGLAFFLSGLFVYLATATNTFLTGSIGMAVVFISIAGLLVLAHEDRRPMSQSEWYGDWRFTSPRAT